MKLRITLLATLVIGVLAACGDDDSNPLDASNPLPDGAIVDDGGVIIFPYDGGYCGCPNTQGVGDRPECPHTISCPL